MADTKKTLSSLIKYSVTDVLILFFSFSLSLNVRRLTNNLPSEMFGIENISAVSSEGNYIGILLIILSTIVLFVLLKRLSILNKKLFRISVIVLLSVSFLIGVIAPGVARYENNVDTFHHGEQLAPAVAFENQKKPYEDLFTLRGAGEDVITPWLSFKIFGESIGSYYLLTGLLQLASLVIFFLLVSFLFKRNFEFLLVSFWFTSTAYDGFYYVRDIFVWVSLGLAVSIITSNRFKAQKVYILGLTSSLSLFYSFDRGIFLSALMAIVLLIIIFLEQKNGTYTLSKTRLTQRILPGAYGILGYLTGSLLMLILLGWSGFSSFIQTTFGEAAKYQGLIFNSPYSKISSETIVDWLPIITILVLVLVIFRTVRSEWGSINSKTLVEVALLFFSVVFFRAASGRPDIGHIAYATPVLFLLLFLVVFRRLDILIGLTKRLRTEEALSLTPLLLLVIIVFSSSVLDYYRLPLMNQAPSSSLKTFLTSPRKSDAFWETTKVEDISTYILDNTETYDSLFVLSSDPIFYYTTKLNNPTRYSISWFADANPLEDEMLADLKKNPPKIIIYESGTYYDRPDFVSMKTRLPKVNAWILENYPKSNSVSGGTIRTK